MKTPFLIIVALLVGVNLYSQMTSLANELKVTVGAQGGYWRDYQYSPARHDWNTKYTQLNYQRTTKHGRRWSVTGQYSSGDATGSNIPEIPADVQAMSLRLMHWRPLPLPLEKHTWGLSWGIGYELTGQFVDFAEEEATNLLAYQQLQLGLEGHWQWHKRHQLYTSFRLPLLSNTVREPYSGFDEDWDAIDYHPIKIWQRGEWQAPWQLWTPRWIVGYRWKMTKRWQLGTQWRTEIQWLTQGKQRAQWLHGLGLSLTYCFGGKAL